MGTSLDGNWSKTGSLVSHTYFDRRHAPSGRVQELLHAPHRPMSARNCRGCVTEYRKFDAVIEILPQLIVLLDDTHGDRLDFHSSTPPVDWSVLVYDHSFL
jgi:hypothetical protein